MVNHVVFKIWTLLLKKKDPSRRLDFGFHIWVFCGCYHHLIFQEHWDWNSTAVFRYVPAYLNNISLIYPWFFKIYRQISQYECSLQWKCQISLKTAVLSHTDELTDMLISALPKLLQPSYHLVSRQSETAGKLCFRKCWNLKVFKGTSNCITKITQEIFQSLIIRQSILWKAIQRKKKSDQKPTRLRPC